MSLIEWAVEAFAELLVLVPGEREMPPEVMRALGLGEEWGRARAIVLREKHAPAWVVTLTVELAGGGIDWQREGGKLWRCDQGAASVKRSLVLLAVTAETDRQIRVGLGVSGTVRGGSR